MFGYVVKDSLDYDKSLKDGFNSLSLHETTRLHRNGYDVISSIYKLNKDTVVSKEISFNCNKNYDSGLESGQVSNTLRALEKFYSEDYTVSEDPVIEWDLDSIREEDSLEDLMDLLHQPPSYR